MQRNVKIYKSTAYNREFHWPSAVDVLSIAVNMVKSRHNHPIEIPLEGNIISVRWWSSDLRIPIWVIWRHLSLGICSFRWQRSQPSWQRWRLRHERPKRCWNKKISRYFIKRSPENDHFRPNPTIYWNIFEVKFWQNQPFEPIFRLKLTMNFCRFLTSLLTLRPC